MGQQIQGHYLSGENSEHAQSKNPKTKPSLVIMSFMILQY